jgi:hypothetical protein
MVPTNTRGNIMRPTFILAAVVCGFVSAAQARPDSLRMSCSQASALVQSHGGIVIGTGPDIYDRFVVGCTFCPDMSYLEPAWIRTGDNPECYVGYRCRDTAPYRPAPSCGFTGYRGP